MSALIISRGIYPDQVGGLEVQVYTLCKYLTNKGFKFKLLTRFYGKKEDIEGYEKILLHKYDKYSPYKYFSFILNGLFQAIKNRSEYNIIFSFGADQSSLIAFFTNIILGKPYIISLRSEKHLEYGFIRSLLFKLLISRASLVHVQTEEIRLNLKSRFDNSYRTIKIPNIIETPGVKN